MKTVYVFLFFSSPAIVLASLNDQIRKIVSFVRVIGTDAYSALDHLLVASPFLPSSFPFRKLVAIQVELCALFARRNREGRKKRDGNERTNIRQTSFRNLLQPFHGKWRYVAAYFKFSPRNFGFVSSLRVWIVFPHPLPSRFYSFPRRHLVPRNFAALSAKLAVYSREGNERNNETSSRDATEDPPIFRWNEWKKR